MGDNVNFLLPNVDHFGKDKPYKQVEEKPRKKGQISKGRFKKKHKTLNRFDAVSDHNVHKKYERRESLVIGLPHVPARAATEQPQETTGQEDETNQVFLPQILMKHTNIWGKRENVKIKNNEKVELEVEGSDLPLPPPKPLTKPRKVDRKSDDNKTGDEDVDSDTDDIPCEVADIRKILHCHIVGMPVEIRKVKDNENQVARPVFHCKNCLDYWLETSTIKQNCTDPEKPVRGPKIQISEETAQLIKSVWSKRQGSEDSKKRKKSSRKKEKTGEKTNISNKTRRKGYQPHSVDIRRKKVQDIVHPDDYNLVLEHIAEGIARNAGFGEKMLNKASQRVAQNLAAIMSGNKPHDQVGMGLIEKHIGETELMILRAMADSEKGNLAQVDNSCKDQRGSNNIQNGNSESATGLLDRLARLKSMETKDGHTDQEEYLTEIFKGKDGRGLVDKYIDVKVPKSHVREQEAEDADTIIDDLLERDNLQCTEDGLPNQPKRAVGGKHSQRIAKAKQYDKKADLNFNLVDNIEGVQLKVDKTSETDIAEDKTSVTDEDNYSLDFIEDDYSSFHSYSSISSTDKSDVSHLTSTTDGGQKVQKTRKSSFHKKEPKHKNKIGPFTQSGRRSRKSLHKVHKTGKQDTKSSSVSKVNKEVVTTDNDKYNQLVEISDSTHIVYDVDDVSDYDSSDDEGGFFIPGNEDYTDSAYDTLVDELVHHFENITTDNNDKMDTSQLKRAMQRGNVKNTNFSKGIKRQSDENKSMETVRSLNQNIHPENIVNEPMQVMHDKEQEIVISDGQITNKSRTKNGSNNAQVTKGRKPSIQKEYAKDSDGGEGSNDLVTSTDKSLLSPKKSNDNKNRRSSHQYSQNGRKSSAMYSNSSMRRFSRINSPGLSGDDVSLGTTDQDFVSSARRGSVMAGSTVTKHVAVGETHFGMQLDALANLPAAPNPLDMNARRRSVVQPPRPKAVTVPKMATKAHHSRQLEHTTIDSTKAQTRTSEFQLPPDPENIKTEPSETEILPTKTVMSTVSTTQVQKSKQAKKRSHHISLKKKDGPVRTLIGQDQHIFEGPTEATPHARPASSKKPLPPINTPEYHPTEDSLVPDSHIQYNTIHAKPVATVKPFVATSSEERVHKSPSHASVQSEGSRTEVSEERPSTHIILPPSDAISILSFTSSYSFSMFSLPNQYRERNDMVKQYMNQVGKTSNKETSQSVLKKIPTKEKRRGSKNLVVTKNKQVMNNLSRKVQKKVTDPKPIARYVKKLEPVKEQASNHIEVIVDNSRESLQSSSANLHSEDNDVEERDKHGSHHCIQEEQKFIEMSDLVAPEQMHSVYASVQLESQMHLNLPAESVIIRVQDYN